MQVGMKSQQQWYFWQPPPWLATASLQHIPPAFLPFLKKFHAVSSRSWCWLSKVRLPWSWSWQGLLLLHKQLPASLVWNALGKYGSTVYTNEGAKCCQSTKLHGYLQLISPPSRCDLFLISTFLCPSRLLFVMQFLLCSLQ